MNDESLGPTGEFPNGKMSDSDQGALNVAIARRHGNVVISFGKPIDWVAMPPADAIDFARTLMKYAGVKKIAIEL